MKILILTQYFWPENFGINHLAAALAGSGHQVTVLTGLPNYPGGRIHDGWGVLRRRDEMWQGVRILRVPLIPRGRGGGLRLALNYLSFAAAASLLGPLAVRDRPDLCLVFQPSPVTVGLPALVLKALKGCPVLFWVQDLWPESLSATGAVKAPWILALVRRMVRFIYRHCDRVLVQSRAFAPRITALGYPPERILYFPNTVEEFYRPVPRPAEDSLPAGFRVMFAGNIGTAQDFPTILAAAERLKDHPAIRWLVVGDGRQRPWVEEEIRRRGLGQCVHLLERRPAEAMPPLYALADALLVTLRRDEIFALTIPSKVQAYLACGRPILAALDGEGARVVTEAGAGLAVPAEDAAALAAAALRLYNLPPAEREAMAARGRACFERDFEPARLQAQLEAWMGAVVGETSR